jgi:BirA family biotin operon repressor/biotin-[acetyl-CoA-carboxylase] ligase
MDEETLRAALRDLPLGGIRYFDQTTSTNDVALAWAAEGAPDLALGCADVQTEGRGRVKRKWFTPPGSALAFSLVLRPSPGEERSIPTFSALGAMAVVEAVGGKNLHPEIKWPNDVLIRRRKFCGVLAEAVWVGEKVEQIVLGIGVNIRPGSVPPAEGLNFPATCLEAEAGRDIERLPLLREILTALLYWRPLVSSSIFLHAWSNRLAFRGEQVEVWTEGMTVKTGQLEGLESDGSLRLRSLEGEVFSVRFGEVHLRPVV